MSRKKLSEVVIIIIMMMIMKMGINECCIESERNGLLEIKSFFNSTHLSSWGSSSDDCCYWGGVECNSTTGHIASLFLDYIGHVDSEENWYLNASLFLPFQQLNLLSLYDNNIAGCIQNQGFERLSTLANFEILDLSYNKFNNTILRSLSGLQALKSLYLRNNIFQGTIDISELSNQTSTLEVLDFSWNEIEGFEMLSTLANLEILHLRGNKINNTILRSLNCLHSLKSLYLGNNSFQGTIDISVLSNLTSTLEELDFSSNEIEGLKSMEGLDMLEGLYLDYNKFNETTTIDFLQSIGRITSFKTLFLTEFGHSDSILANTSLKGLCNLKHLVDLFISGCDLNGDLPKCLGNMTSLQFLDISSNRLRIPISLSPFFDLSKLTFLYANNNTIYEDTEGHNLIPKFQLQELYMDGYGEGGELPKFLYRQHNLESVAISSMKLRGGFPYWLLENNTGLHTLKLSNNSFSGPIQLPHRRHANLTALDISDNFFNGSIPSKFGILFPNLVSLAMSGNELKESIPDSLCNMSAFSVLDLSNNNFSGMIPSWIGELSDLEFLVLGHNNLQGKIPIELCSLEKLRFLDLSHNNLQGMIPPQLSKLTYLEAFSVSYNNLSGPVPIAMYQFGTLSESSSKGNPFLCGLPLSKSCSSLDSNAIILLKSDSSRNWFIDMEDFFVSFGISYGMVLLTLAAVLCINPYWRRLWFYYVQRSINKTYYYIIDNVIPLISKF